MLFLQENVDQITTHVLDPVVEQVCRKMLDQLDATSIIGEHMYINTGYTAASKTSDISENPVLEDNRMDVEADVIMNPYNTEDSSTTTENNRPVHDKELNRSYYNRHMVLASKYPRIDLMVSSVPCSIQMSCKLTIKSREQAHRIFDTLMSVYSGAYSLTYQDIFYNYNVPKKIITALYILYTAHNPDDSGFAQYLMDKSNVIDITMDRELKNSELVIRKHTTNAMLKVQVDGNRPEAQGRQSNVPEKYVIGFTTILQFSRPHAFILRYPIVIDNKLIPDTLTPRIPDDELLKDIYGKHDTLTMSDYELIYQRFDGCRPIIQPWYDQWKVPPDAPFIEYQYKRFFQGIVLLDLENPETVIDLAEPLDTYIRLTDDVLQQIRDQGSGSLWPEAHLIVGLYSDDTFVEPSTLSLDGTILRIPNKDITKTYRLVLAHRKEKRYAYRQWFTILDASIIVTK